MKDQDLRLCYFHMSSTVIFGSLLAVLLFMGLFIPLGYTQIFAQDSEKGLILYRNPEASLEMKYPSSWEMREYPADDNNGSIIEFLGPSTGAEPRMPSVNIFIFSSGNQSIEQAVSEAINGLENIQVNSTIMELGELNGTAQVLDYEVVTAHQEFRKMQLWVEKPERTYVITYTDSPEKFSVYRPQVMEMITTLKIT